MAKPHRRGPAWTEREDRVLIERDDLTLKQIGDMIGRTEISVKNRRVRLIARGLDDPRYQDFTDSEKAFVIRNPEMNLEDVAGHLGRSASSVGDLRQALIGREIISARTTRSSPEQRAPRHHQPWTAGEDALLIGAALPDHDVAIQTGRTLHAIRSRRVSLKNRTATMARSAPVEWHILHASPTETNHAVAVRLGIRRGVVQRIRAHGWTCRIFIVPCAECGALVTKRSLPPRVTCAACHAVIRSRANRASRARETTAPTVPPTERPWTAAEDARLRETYGRITGNQIADELGRSANGVYKRAQRLGLTRASSPSRDHDLDQDQQQQSERRSRQRYQPWTHDDDACLIAHHDDRDHEIAAHLGRTLWAVRTRTGKLRKDGRIA